MLRSTRLLAIPLLAAGLLLVCGANEAKAQIRVQIGGFGLKYLIWEMLDIYQGL